MGVAAIAMYFRIVRAKGAKGRDHEYVRLVESYRDKGKNKQRTVANLGRKDLLLPHLDSLNRLLRGDGRPSDTVRIGAVEAVQAWDWGPVLVARHLWRALGLEQILDQLEPRRSRQTAPLADRVFALVANRLCLPSSEHGLARWLEHTFVCDRRGQPWQPQWRSEAERRASRAPRVRVQFRQLQQWYRTLDQLCPLKQEIEREMFHRVGLCFRRWKNTPPVLHPHPQLLTGRQKVWRAEIAGLCYLFSGFRLGVFALRIEELNERPYALDFLPARQLLVIPLIVTDGSLHR